MSEFREYKCTHCAKPFKGRVRDRKKGLALFCSKSCAASANSSRQQLFDKTCRNCAKDFTTPHITTKYCSVVCKESYLARLRRLDRRKGLFKKLAALPCELCGYTRASRDVHHITPISEGGTNDMLNLISLCPNCHRECHEMSFSRDHLFKIVNRRDNSIFS
jgi:5-methylcytosine-specific restriction endonuclease McrA